MSPDGTLEDKGGRTRWLAAMAGAAAIGLITRAVFLGRESFWYDEAVSALVASKPLGELLYQCAMTEMKPPVYHLMLKPLIALGRSEALLRAPSVLFGVGTVVLAGMLGARVASRRVGAAAAFMAAVNPLLVHYSREARMYSLLAFLAVATTLLLVVAAKAKGWKSAVGWAAYSALLAAGTLTHPYFALLAMAHLAFAAATFRERSARMGFWIGLLIAAAISALWLPYFELGLRNLNEGAWQRTVNLSDVPNAFRHFAVSYPSPRSSRLGAKVFMAASALVFALLFLKGILSRAFGRGGKALVLLALFLPMGVTFAAGAWARVYNVRYLEMLCPFFLVILAAGTMGARSAKLRAGGLSLALLFFAGSLAFYFVDPNYRNAEVREAMLHIEKRAREGDAVLHLAYTTYFPELLYGSGSAEPFLLGGRTPLPYYYGGKLIEPGGMSSARELLRKHRRLWVLVEKPTEEWVKLTPAEEKLKPAVGGRAAVVERVDFHGVAVFLCEPKAKGT